MHRCDVKFAYTPVFAVFAKNQPTIVTLIEGNS